MGSDADGEPDERPQHTRNLPTFRIDRTEVSREDFFRCVQAGVCADAWARPTWTNPRAAVTSVSWHQARTYCHWTGARLPTEAEWEKAARGTEARQFPWGNEAPTRERAVYGLRINVGQPATVGSHPTNASPYGALDMAGNVWEWVEDVYDPFAYRRPESVPTCARAMGAYAELQRMRLWAFTGAMGIPNTCQRVLRGGAWNYWPSGLRSTNRVHHEPEGRYPVSGFRCADDGASANVATPTESQPH
jgi:formylglycine-generating enzyme required for sulfatase activity